MMAKMKKVTPKKTATPVIMWIKCSISTAMGVLPVSRPDVRVAMRPMTVRSPVQITTPRAVPGVDQKTKSEIQSYRCNNFVALEDDFFLFYLKTHF